jgi:hypothetical protein
MKEFLCRSERNESGDSLAIGLRQALAYYEPKRNLLSFKATFIAPRVSGYPFRLRLLPRLTIGWFHRAPVQRSVHNLFSRWPQLFPSTLGPTASSRSRPPGNADRGRSNRTRRGKISNAPTHHRSCTRSKRKNLDRAQTILQTTLLLRHRPVDRPTV